MSITTLTDQYSVSAALDEAGIAAAAQLGFKSLINNRFDGESPGQAPSEAVAAMAAAHGMTYYHIPVFSGPDPSDDIAALAAALGDAPGPVLAYCLSGKRSVVLWAMAQVRTAVLSPDEVIAACSEAGFDVSGLRPQLDQLYQS